MPDVIFTSPNQQHLSTDTEAGPILSSIERNI